MTKIKKIDNYLYPDEPWFTKESLIESWLDNIKGIQEYNLGGGGAMDYIPANEPHHLLVNKYFSRFEKDITSMVTELFNYSDKKSHLKAIEEEASFFTDTLVFKTIIEDSSFSLDEKIFIKQSRNIENLKKTYKQKPNFLRFIKYTNYEKKGKFEYENAFLETLSNENLAAKYEVHNNFYGELSSDATSLFSFKYILFYWESKLQLYKNKIIKKINLPKKITITSLKSILKKYSKKEIKGDRGRIGAIVPKDLHPLLVCESSIIQRIKKSVDVLKKRKNI